MKRISTSFPHERVSEIFPCVCGFSYIKTRRRQKECVACMKLHNSIAKHCQLKIVTQNKITMSEMSL